MRSYPNFIPLSAREVEHIGKALSPFQFDMIYGHYFDRVIAKDAKQVLEKSVARYVAAINGTRGYCSASKLLAMSRSHYRDLQQRCHTALPAGARCAKQ